LDPRVPRITIGEAPRGSQIMSFDEKGEDFKDCRR
jgi:hypothetical protein